MTVPPYPHACPGGCGVMVGYEKLACPNCWRRLPGPMRSAITRAAARDDAGGRLRAVSAALTWYRKHRTYGDSL